MSCEPIRSKIFLGGFDARRHVFALDPHHQGKFREMKDAVPALGKHDNLVLGVLDELASPALPTHRLNLYGLLLTPQHLTSSWPHLLTPFAQKMSEVLSSTALRIALARFSQE